MHYCKLNHNCIMGAANPHMPSTVISASSETDFMKQLTYIQSAQTDQLGSIEIYRFKQPPYDYLMKSRRFFSNSDPLLSSYLKNLETVVNQLNHKNVVQIHYYKTIAQFQMCGRHTEIETYCNYYALSLSDVITKRRKDDIRFISNEIWYVLKSLLEVSVLLRKHSYNFGAYRSRNITLSSEGYLKLYILHLNKLEALTENQLPSEYSEPLNDRQNIHKYLPMPPQYLPAIRDCNLNFKFQLEKEDSFMIAMVILEMMTDDDVRKYYMLGDDGFYHYKKAAAWKDLNMLGYVYDKKYLLPLIEKMLNENPSKRISPEQALQFISQNRDNINMGGSLRMFQDEQNVIKPKLSYRTSFDFESNVLKTIQANILEHKLTACPIKTFSKKNPVKSIGVSLTSSKKSIETKDKSLNKESRLLLHTNLQSHRGNSLSSKLGLHA